MPLIKPPGGSGGPTPIGPVPTGPPAPPAATLPDWWAIMNTPSYPSTGVILPGEGPRGVGIGDVSPDELLPEILGRDRVRGTLVYLGPYGGNNIITHAKAIVVWSEGEIDAVEQLYWNDAKLATVTYPNGASVTITHHRGDVTVVPSVFGAAYDTTGWHDHAWTEIQIIGVASGYVIPWWSVVNTEAGTIPTVSADIRGRRMFDPRVPLAANAWSQNQALIVRHLLTVWGKRLATEIDDASVSAAATVIDARGFKFNYTFTSKTKLQDAIHAVLASCSGTLTRTNGKLGIFIDTTNAAAALLTLDESTGGIYDIEYSWLSKKDRPTRVIVKFKNAASNYADDQTPALEDLRVALDTVPVRELSVEAQGVTGLDEAVILRDYIYNSQAITFRINATAAFAGQLLTVGAKVHVKTLKAVDGDFLVEQIGETQGGFFPLVLRPYDAAVYGTTPISQGGPSTPDWLFGLPAPFSAPFEVPALGTSAGYAMNGLAVGTYDTRIFWDAPRYYKAATRFPTAWTGSARWTSLDGSKVNDGDLATTAGVTNNGSADVHLYLDCGAGVTKTFGRLVVTLGADVGASDALGVAYSDDGIAYTTAEWADQWTISTGGVIDVEWRDVGAHRYWRWTFIRATGLETISLKEAQPYEIAADNPWVANYRIYRLTGGVQGALLTVIEAGQRPTMANPLDLAPFEETEVYAGQFYKKISVAIVAVTRLLNTSAGVALVEIATTDGSENRIVARQGTSAAEPQLGTSIYIEHEIRGGTLKSDGVITGASLAVPHAATHAAAGTDPVTITEGQVTNLTTDLAAKVALQATTPGTPQAGHANLTGTGRFGDVAIPAATGFGIGSLASYANDDVAKLRSYWAQNYPGANQYFRALDVVPPAGNTQTVTRFFGQTSSNAAPVEVARLAPSGGLVVGDTNDPGAGNLGVGNSAATHSINLNGIGSGTNGGAALVVSNGGGTYGFFGNRSAALGGAFDGTMEIGGYLGLKFDTLWTTRADFDTNGVFSFHPDGTNTRAKHDAQGSLLTLESARVTPWVEPQVAASGGVTVTSATAQDITGATITFTPPSDCRVLVLGAFDVAVTNSAAAFIGELQVKTGAGAFVAQTPNATRAGGSTGARSLDTAAWTLALTGGTAYTLKLTGRVATAGTASWAVQANTTTLTLLGVGRF